MILITLPPPIPTVTLLPTDVPSSTSSADSTSLPPTDSSTVVSSSDASSLPSPSTSLTSDSTTDTSTDTTTDTTTDTSTSIAACAATVPPLLNDFRLLAPTSASSDSTSTSSTLPPCSSTQDTTSSQLLPVTSSVVSMLKLQSIFISLPLPPPPSTSSTPSLTTPTIVQTTTSTIVPTTSPTPAPSVTPSKTPTTPPPQPPPETTSSPLALIPPLRTLFMSLFPPSDTATPTPPSVANSVDFAPPPAATSVPPVANSVPPVAAPAPEPGPTPPTTGTPSPPFSPTAEIISVIPIRSFMASVPAITETALSMPPLVPIPFPGESGTGIPFLPMPQTGEPGGGLPGSPGGPTAGGGSPGGITPGPHDGSGPATTVSGVQPTITSTGVLNPPPSGGHVRLNAGAIASLVVLVVISILFAIIWITLARRRRRIRMNGLAGTDTAQATANRRWDRLMDPELDDNHYTGSAVNGDPILRNLPQQHLSVADARWGEGNISRRASFGQAGTDLLAFRSREFSLSPPHSPTSPTSLLSPPASPTFGGSHRSGSHERLWVDRRTNRSSHAHSLSASNTPPPSPRHHANPRPDSIPFLITPSEPEVLEKGRESAGSHRLRGLFGFLRRSRTSSLQPSVENVPWQHPVSNTMAERPSTGPVSSRHISVDRTSGGSMLDPFRELSSSSFPISHLGTEEEDVTPAPSTARSSMVAEDREMLQDLPEFRMRVVDSDSTTSLGDHTDYSPPIGGIVLNMPGTSASLPSVNDRQASS